MFTTDSFLEYKTMHFKRFRIAVVALTLVAAPLSSQTVVTPSNPNGWGLDPVRAPLNGGTQGITTTTPINGNASLEMNIINNGAQHTGYAIFGNFGLLSQVTTLGFDWLSPSGLQSPTFRAYLNLVNPAGGAPLLAQFGWYADNAINGTVPTSGVTTTDLMDNDGNNKFFFAPLWSKWSGWHELRREFTISRL